MTSQPLSILAQASLFVFGVYLQKFIRKSLFNRQRGKQVKQTMRIVICAIVTCLILLYDYQTICNPQGISFVRCFYLGVNPLQIVHVLVANSLLFAAHINEKVFKNMERYHGREINLKTVVVAPLLEELLFRGGFFRMAAGQISVFLLAFIFSISHLHKSVRKWLKKKDPRWSAAFGQVVFTYVFGLYSFYFLYTWNSVIPSIILHCYCNWLGAPSIRKDNLKLHILCICLAISYCFVFVQ